MAVEFKKPEEKDKQPLDQPSIISGDQAQGGQVNPQQATSSGRFTNIQNYLKANQQNTLGQSVANRIGDVAQGVKSDIGREQQKFQENTSKAFNPFQGGSEFVQKAVYNAPEVAGDESNINRFRTIAQGQYGGPKALENTSSLQAGVQNTQALSGLTGSEGGRKALLQTFFANPQYTGGQRSLDNLLLQSDQRQTSALGAARRSASDVNKTLNEANLQAMGTGLKNEQTARLLGEEANKTLNEETTKRDQEIQDALKSASEKELAMRNLIENTRTGIQRGEIDKDTAQKLGINAIFGQGNEASLYDLDPTNYLKQNLSDEEITKQNIASNEQALRMNALAKLAGKTGEYDPTKAGTFKGSSQEFNQEQFLKDQAAKKEEADALVNRAKAVENLRQYIGGTEDEGVYRMPSSFNSLEQAIQYNEGLRNLQKQAGLEQRDLINVDLAKKIASMNPQEQEAYARNLGVQPGANPSDVIRKFGLQYDPTGNTDYSAGASGTPQQVTEQRANVISALNKLRMDPNTLNAIKKLRLV